jgi:hypothetical protein
MDSLSIITLFALVLALAMVAITARVLRDERRRSDARVAALAAAAEEPAADRRTGFPVESTGGIAPRATYVGDLAPARRPRSPWVTREEPGVPPQAGAAQAAHRASAADDFELYPSAPATGVEVGSTGMFAASQASSGRSRLMPIAAAAILIAGAGAGFAFWSSSRAASVDARAGAAATTAPLELVALKHRRDGERLAISGIIKNPSGAPAVRNVTAVVFLFDESGSFLSSGRAPIDFTTLAPGDESPFVVVVSEPGAVARYRVSFRSDEHVVPHIDRREPGGAGGAPAVSRSGNPPAVAHAVQQP